MATLGGMYTPTRIRATVTPSAYYNEKIAANIPMLRSLQMGLRGGAGRGFLHMVAPGVPKLIFHLHQISWLLDSVLLAAVEKGLKIFEGEAKKQLDAKTSGSEYSTGLMSKAITHKILQVSPYIHGRVYVEDLAYPPQWRRGKGSSTFTAAQYYTEENTGARLRMMMNHTEAMRDLIGKKNASGGQQMVPIPKPGRGMIFYVHPATEFKYKFTGFNFMLAAYRKKRVIVNTIIQRALAGLMSGRGGPGWLGGAGQMYPGGVTLTSKAIPVSLKGMVFTSYGGLP